MWQPSGRITDLDDFVRVAMSLALRGRKRDEWIECGGYTANSRHDVPPLLSRPPVMSWDEVYVFFYVRDTSQVVAPRKLIMDTLARNGIRGVTPTTKFGLCYFPFLPCHIIPFVSPDKATASRASIIAAMAGAEGIITRVTTPDTTRGLQWVSRDTGPKKND